MAWSNVTGADTSRQFLTIGPIGTDDVDFVLSVDESHPIIISDDAQPFPLLQEVMETP